MLIDSLRKTANSLDASLSGKLYGRLIVNIADNIVVVETDNGTHSVDDGDTVEVITYDESERVLTSITRQQAIETMAYGTDWPLFAGFNVFVKKRSNEPEAIGVDVLDGIIQNLRNAKNESEAFDSGKAYGLLRSKDGGVYVETQYSDKPTIELADDDVIEVLTYDRDNERTVTKISRSEAESFVGQYVFLSKRKDG